MGEQIAMSAVVARRTDTGAVTMDVDTAAASVNGRPAQEVSPPMPSATWLTMPMIVAQIVMLILIATLCTYGDSAKVGDSQVSAIQNELTQANLVSFLMGVHIMVFVGFGFLMAFLQHGGLASLTHNLLLAALAMQWSILTNGFWVRAFGHGPSFWDPIELTTTELIKAEFVAATALISLGAVLGRVHEQHLLLLALLIPFFQGLNEAICAGELKAVDMGGSLLVHAFGALFGLAMAKFYRAGRKQKAQRIAADAKNTDDATSNKFAFAGTLFLIIYWPYFNGALAQENAQRRVILNTILAMAASSVTAISVSRLASGWSKHGHNAVDVWDATNAVFAGGVAIGSSSDLVSGPGGAIGMGFAGGALCVLVRRWLGSNPCGDTCGVTYVHGLVGLLGGLGGIISAAVASDVVYGESIVGLFPARGPPTNWTAQTQALHQFYAFMTTIALALSTGAITGRLLRLFSRPPPEVLYTDEVIYEKED